MRITRSDHRNLVIVDFPYLIGAIAFPCAAIMLGVTVTAIASRKNIGDIIGPIIGALMFFFGAAVFTKRSEFNFDFISRKLTWRRRGLFTNTGGVIPLDQITAATVESCSDGDGDTYRVCLRTTAGSIPLTQSYDGNRAKADQVRTAINEALKVKLDADQQVENDILEMALAGRKIDAIALARTRYGYDLTQAKQFVDDLTK